MWLQPLATDDNTVVSDIGEQWSPQTAPTRQHETAEYRMCMLDGSATPLTLMTAQVSGTTSGNRIPIVPQLVPVVNAVNAASTNTTAGTSAGGSESAITPMGLSGFARMNALSRRNDNPQAASRPFDKDRDGFVLSEGAGVVVLEEYEHARQRGATIYAEVLGYGMSADASHMTAPDPEGAGAARAMSSALRDARLEKEQVDYINAHGTSTPLGDVAETTAIKSVFNSHSKKLCVSSTKSQLGHLLGASGGVEFVVSALALHHQTAPPTINLDNPDPQCDLDYVPNEARPMKLNTVLTNSFGFGGHNACLILGKAG